MKQHVLSAFIDFFGKQPQHILFAPGRANIIGEHTDYNDGFVLPFAIHRGIWFCANTNETNLINIRAYNADEFAGITLPDLESNQSYGWLKFLLQVLKVMPESLNKGFDMVFGGDLPIGAGISSSSALSCGFTALIKKIISLDWSEREMLDIAIRAERGYGVRGGIMDQFTIFNGKKNQAILLDCKSNLHKFIPLNLGDHKFYLFNTNVQHNLLHTDYNSRRDECDAAIKEISRHYRADTKSLGDINVGDLSALQDILDDLLYKRVSFVVEENDRVSKAVNALAKNDMNTLGALLYQTHDGLSKLYQVSCNELDWLVHYTFDQDAILGARMMGGGFGGCTINLINGSLSDAFIAEMKLKYYQNYGLYPDIFEVCPSDGILALI